MLKGNVTAVRGTEVTVFGSSSYPDYIVYDFVSA